MRSDRAFILFHLKVGTRLSLRLLSPLLAAVFIMYYLFGPEFIIQVALILFRESGLFVAGFTMTLVLTGVSKVAERRISAGFLGWIRHLPSEGRHLRRTAILAIFLAEAPTIAVVGVLAIFVTRDLPSRALAVALGLIISGLGAASFVVTRWKRPISKFLSLVACWVGPSGSWVMTAAGVGLLFLTDLAGGPIDFRLRKPGVRRSEDGIDLETLMIWRAVGWRFLSALLVSALAPAAALLFIHNSKLTARNAISVSVGGAVLFLSIFIGLTAGIIEKRRPVWAWARSLPRSASYRVLHDAGAFFVFSLAGIIGLFWAPGRPFLPAAVVLPFLSLRASARLREGTPSRWGIPGVLAGEGFFIALSVALIPFSSWVFLTATPLAFLDARAKERKLKPGRWDEMRHLGAGDPLSWSSS
jgi:hypothetical protein